MTAAANGQTFYLPIPTWNPDCSLFNYAGNDHTLGMMEYAVPPVSQFTSFAQDPSEWGQVERLNRREMSQQLGMPDLDQRSEESVLALRQPDINLLPVGEF